MLKIDFNDMLYALSYALDCVEHELIGVATHHSKRVAYLCWLVGKELHFTDKQLRDVMACAILHDNALTEYIKYEHLRGVNIIEQVEKMDTGRHCSMGENNMKLLPMDEECTNAILYHHENVDGSGPFGKTVREIPLYAQLIRLGDQLDAIFNLSFIDEVKFKNVRRFVKEKEGVLCTSSIAEAFLGGFTCETAFLMQSEKLDILLNVALPETVKELQKEEMINMANLFANIIDYKSEFTRRHSMGMAQKAMTMTTYYGYDEETAVEMYLAGALHDVGKLVIDKDVLEKPDRLTAEEYRHIQNHAYYTYDILRRVKGLEQITAWASSHHEKLNGTGYPFGKKGDQLDQLERLMACLDIYQALTEARPYKKPMSHRSAIKILEKSVRKNELDGTIVADINHVFGAS